MKKVNEISREYTVSIRTLHYYDEIGLLVPTRQNGVRLYSSADESVLKLILLYKESGLSLADIQQLILNNDFSSIQAKRNDLIQKRDRINEMIIYLDQLTLIKHHPLSLDELKNPFGIAMRHLVGDEHTNRAFDSPEMLDLYTSKLTSIFDRFQMYKNDPIKLQEVIKDYYDYFRVDLHMGITLLDFKALIKEGMDSSDFLSSHDKSILMKGIESFIEKST